MAIDRRNLFTVVFIVSMFSISGFKQLEAARLLEGEEWLRKGGIVLESLKKGPIPPSGPSCDTHIPSSRCTLSEMNIAGRGSIAPPTSPDVTADVAVIPISKEAKHQQVSST